MKQKQEHFFLTHNSLACHVEVPNGVKEPTGSHLSPAHTYTTYTLILLSLRLLCHLGFQELPGTFKEQKKGRRALGLSWQHRGKLANGPGNLNKKNKVVIPQRQLNIQIFFCICTAPYATGARRGWTSLHELFSWSSVFPISLVRNNLPERSFISPLLRNNYCFKQVILHVLNNHRFSGAKFSGQLPAWKGLMLVQSSEKLQYSHQSSLSCEMLLLLQWTSAPFPDIWRLLAWDSVRLKGKKKSWFIFYLL